MIPFLFVLSLAASPEPPAPDATEVIPTQIRHEALYATVRVTNLGSDTRVASGVTIGVIDGFAYVLTASHALGQDGDRRVDFFTKASEKEPDTSLSTRPTDVAVLMRSPTPDFAILKVLLPKKEVDRQPSSALPTKREFVAIAPPVARLAPVLDRPKRFPVTAYATGCSMNGAGPPTAVVTTLIGKKLFKRSPSDSAIFWETELPHESGRSGGPLFDKDGRVIGICAANQSNVNHGYFTHIDEIQAWMIKNGLDGLIDTGFGK